MKKKKLKKLKLSNVIVSLPSEEEIEKISYQFLSDVAITTNTERKIEKRMFIKGAEWMKTKIKN